MTKSSTISGANLLLMAIMMVKMMIIIMLMMMMILIAIKIMDIEYICRISLNTMQIKVSSAMIYDFNQLVCICVNAVCSRLGWFYDGAAATPHSALVTPKTNE